MTRNHKSIEDKGLCYGTKLRLMRWYCLHLVNI